MLEDKLLVWKLRGGSRDALRTIYQRYKDDLLRLAAGLLNDATAAEDVVHDVFTVFTRSSRRFQLRGSLKGYLATCVANRARNLNRDEYRRKTVPLAEALGIGCESEQPEHWLIAHEQFSRLTDALAEYKYSEAARVLYEFSWDEFCSFFVEMVKGRLQDEAARPVAQRVLAHTLDTILRLLHPMIPFLTEEVWQLLAEAAPERGIDQVRPAAASIMVAPWPESDPARHGGIPSKIIG